MSKMRGIASITRRSEWLLIDLIGLTVSIIAGLYLSSLLTEKIFLEKLTLLKFTSILFVQFCCLVATGAFYRRSFRRTHNYEDGLLRIIAGSMLSVLAMFSLFTLIPYLFTAFTYKPLATAFFDAAIPGMLAAGVISLIHTAEQAIKSRLYRRTTVLFVEVEQHWYDKLPEIRDVLNEDWHLGIVAMKHLYTPPEIADGIEVWDEARLDSWLDHEAEIGHKLLIVLGENQPKISQHDRLIRKAYGTPLVMTNMIDFYEEVLEKVPMFENITNWHCAIGLPRTSYNDLALKRLMDIFVASLLLVPALPVMAVLCMKIRRESDGPAIFRQQRLGYLGKEFTCYKLRTMAVHEDDGAQWPAFASHKVTPLGKKLRRLGLDELPQLINVLKGDMSLIGPRPARPEVVARHEQRLPFYAAQRSVKPGISGWAQIHQGQDSGDDTLFEKTRYNLFYTKNFSFGLDLLIYIRTFAQLITFSKSNSTRQEISATREQNSPEAPGETVDHITPVTSVLALTSQKFHNVQWLEMFFEHRLKPFSRHFQKAIMSLVVGQTTTEKNLALNDANLSGPADMRATTDNKTVQPDKKAKVRNFG